MKSLIKTTLLVKVILLMNTAVQAQQNDTALYHEQYRPQLHFSPSAHWMNDPNGMVYFKNTYHLFFQYYPGGTTWGPMHWGHAESKDLIHWQEKPIALYPDSLGYIFSGSAVVDKQNTSGFGKNGIVPLVAIFTSHDPKGEKSGKNDFQTESLAYSLDNGESWTKYGGNPVLKNPGVRDFRDPKVIWFEKTHKWIMTLAVHDHVDFYSSPDLKSWTKESSFGGSPGAHGGVWECPDLFPLTYLGKEYWILLGNLNPGGPNGGSATQYFVGQFDGIKFSPADDQTKWLDYGPDEYAGVTWSNTGNRRIFLGWMSNWEYANQVPSKRWRNAMTLPRELKLAIVGKTLFVKSLPVPELKQDAKPFFLHKTPINKSLKAIKLPAQSLISLKANAAQNYVLCFTNPAGDTLRIGFDKTGSRYFIDRIKSGQSDFNPSFTKPVNYSPRISKLSVSDLVVVVDKSSIELFADGGLSVMTATFFPHQDFNLLTITDDKGSAVRELKIDALSSIWK